MRKRIVRLCLLAALLCMALGLNVNAATHSHTQCGGSTCTCGSGHTAKTWTAWNGTSTLYSSNYYLTSDVELSSTKIINSGYNVKLCLNGHKLTCDGEVLSVLNNGSLYICDCVGTGSIESTDGSSAISNSGYCFLYGGTIAGGVYNDKTLYVHGGTIKGEPAVFNSQDTTFQMAGGTVQATSYYAMENDEGAACTISGGRVTSGGEYALSNYLSTVNISAGTVTGIIGSGTLEISGGSISGTFRNNGTATVTGGTIQRIDNFNALDLSGTAKITGALYANGTKTCLSGSPTIAALLVGKAVSAMNLAGTASYSGGTIPVSVTESVSTGSVVISNVSSQTIANKFSMEPTNGKLDYVGTNLVYKGITASGNCGAQGDNLKWTLYGDGELVISGTGDMADYTTSAGPGWRSYSTKIKSVTVEQGTASIGDYAFYASYNTGYYTNLTEVSLPDGITGLGEHAFDYCINLETINLPDSITDIGARCFYMCGKMDVSHLPTGVKEYAEGAFYHTGADLTAPSPLVIPDGVTKIGANAFAECYNRTGITLPGTLTDIGSYAFGKNGEYTVVIPASVTTIGSNAFCHTSSYTGQTKIYFCGDAPEMYSLEYSGVCYVYYPEGRSGWDSNGLDTTHHALALWPDEEHCTVKGSYVAASCTLGGGYTYSCPHCGYSYVASDGTAPLGHSYGTGKVTTPATCTEKGTMTYTCSRCGDTKSEEIPASGHSWSTEWSSDSANHWHVCTACGEKKDEAAHVSSGSATETENETCTVCCYVIAPALGHVHTNHLNPVVEKEATCTETGNQAYYICDCGIWFADADALHEITDHSSVVVPAKGHTPVPVPGKDATCTETGLTEGSKCAVCAEVLVAQTEIPAKGHSWDDGAVTTKATCKNEGVTTYTCAVCEDTKTESIPMTDHDYVGKPPVAATCTTPGYTAEYVCRVCQHATGGNMIPALGHSFTTYVYNNDAKVGVDGTETAACDRDGCHATDTRTAAGTALPAPPVAFIDVPSSAYYAPAVNWAVANNITAGTTPTTFSPDDTCTRAQVVAFLWRAAGRPEPEAENNPFTDVKKSDYFYKAVLWASENGIVYGTSSTTFSPNQGCTRAQVAAFLWRAKGRPEPTTGNNPFTDVKASEYYSKAVIWAAENKIVYGTSATQFSPDASCTRAQIVTFLYRTYGK